VLNYSTPSKAWAEPRVGFVNLFPDGDGVVRRATFRLDATNGARLLPPGAVMYSLAARAVEKIGQADALPRTGIPQRFLYTAPPGAGYRPHSLASLFVPERWHTEFGDGTFFKDKIVIIGPAAKIFGEEYTTPYPGHPRMLEPELQLNMISATVNHHLLRELSSRANLFTVALGGILAFVLALALRRWAVRLVVVLLGVIVYWIACRLCLDYAKVMVLPLLPAVAFALSGVAVCVRDFLAGRAAANQAASKTE
jgi:CHASE2 domain-containing sensor protein